VALGAKSPKERSPPQERREAVFKRTGCEELQNIFSKVFIVSHSAILQFGKRKTTKGRWKKADGQVDRGSRQQKGERCAAVGNLSSGGAIKAGRSGLCVEENPTIGKAGVPKKT